MLTYSCSDFTNYQCYRYFRRMSRRLQFPANGTNTSLRWRHALVFGLRAVNPLYTHRHILLHLTHPNQNSYDRMSPSFRSYLETLTATCAQPVFESACKAGGYEVMSPRGSPLN